jgi:hypothetical protein
VPRQVIITINGDSVPSQPPDLSSFSAREGTWCAAISLRFQMLFAVGLLVAPEAAARDQCVARM